MEAVNERTLGDVAGEALAQFEERARADGEAFTTLKDDAPQWLHDVARGAHGDMLPDDWRYATIQAAIEAIVEANAAEGALDDLAHEFADGNVDTYSGARLEWLASHLIRQGYCDQAREEGLVANDASTIDRIGAGQYVESLEVFEQVRSALGRAADAIESEGR